MENIRLFDTIEDYNKEKDSLPYPCVSTTLEDLNTIYYTEPNYDSYVTCVYDMNSVSQITAMTLCRGYITDYSVNGVKVDVEPEIRTQLTSKNYFTMGSDYNGNPRWLPDSNAEPTFEDVAKKEVIFTLNRPLKDDDYVIISGFRNSQPTVALVKDAQETIGKYVVLSEDCLSYTLYPSSKQRAAQQIKEDPWYSGNTFNVNFAFVDSTWVEGGYQESPTLSTTITINEVSSGINDIILKSSDCDENGLATVSYKLATNANKIDVFSHSRLISVNFELNPLKNYLLDDSFANYGSFSGSTKLTSIVLPDNIISIGVYAFKLCSQLSSVTLGNNLKSIDYGAFERCTNLTSINIPNSVITIDDHTFDGCSKLTSIICNATTAPTIKYTTFLGVSSNGTLQVPQGSDYSTWMSASSYYLGYYGWTLEYIS